jgi:biopolymer transport protein ExbD
MRQLSTNFNEGNFGFQIAPMIDVVFVIMLFFMVMAGTVKVEKEINTQLPGVSETREQTQFVDEIVINVAEDGQITLNDEEFDTPNSHDLPNLKATLLRLKQAADAAKSPSVVTIVSDPGAKYSRTVDVLDALAVAKITSVTFTVSEPE